MEQRRRDHAARILLPRVNPGAISSLPDAPMLTVEEGIPLVPGSCEALGASGQRTGHNALFTGSELRSGLISVSRPWNLTVQEVARWLGG